MSVKNVCSLKRLLLLSTEFTVPKVADKIDLPIEGKDTEKCSTIYVLEHKVSACQHKFSN